MPYSDEAMQRQMVRYVTGVVTEVGLVAKLRPDCAERLAVYRRSFRARTVSVLQETLLAPVSRLFGVDLVQATLAQFVAGEPPRASALAASLAGFPDFLRRMFAGDVKPLFCLMVEASLARWDLLTGPDPSALAAGDRRLKPCRHISGAAEVDLFAAWVAATQVGSAAAPPACIDGLYGIECTPSDLLLVKASPTDLLAVHVTPAVRPVVVRLAAGRSLTEAVSDLSPIEAESMPASELADVITALVTGRAL